MTSSAPLYNNLGKARSDVGAYRSAIEVLERAVELSPDRPEYHLNLGNALRGEQRYADAAKAYERSLRVGGGHAGGLYKGRTSSPGGLGNYRTFTGNGHFSTARRWLAQSAQGSLNTRCGS